MLVQTKHRKNRGGADQFLSPNSSPPVNKGFHLAVYGPVWSLLFLNVLVSYITQIGYFWRGRRHISAEWILTIPHYLSVAINVSLVLPVQKRVSSEHALRTVCLGWFLGFGRRSVDGYLPADWNRKKTFSNTTWSCYMTLIHSLPSFINRFYTPIFVFMHLFMSTIFRDLG